MRSIPSFEASPKGYADLYQTVLIDTPVGASATHPRHISPYRAVLGPPVPCCVACACAARRLPALRGRGEAGAEHARSLCRGRGRCVAGPYFSQYLQDNSEQLQTAGEVKRPPYACCAT